MATLTKRQRTKKRRWFPTIYDAPRACGCEAAHRYHCSHLKAGVGAMNRLSDRHMCPCVVCHGQGVK